MIPVLVALLLSLFLAVAVGIAAAIPRVTDRENLLTPRGEERALEAATRTLELAAALRARAAVQQDKLRVGMAASGVRVRARAAALPPVGRLRPAAAPLGTGEQHHSAARPEAPGRSARHVAGPLRRSAAAARHRVAAAGRRRRSTAAAPAAVPASAAVRPASTTTARPAAAVAGPAAAGSGATPAVRRVRSASASLTGRQAHRAHQAPERELVSVGASSPVELPVEVDLRATPAEPAAAGSPRRAAAATTGRSPRPGPRHRG